MRRKDWVTVARAVLFVGGVCLAYWLIRGVGFGRVLEVLRSNWEWIPLVAVLESLFVSMDLVSLRVLLGDAAGRIPMSAWVRSTAVAYASTILLPAGRAAGEAGRAATLAPSVGAADSVAVGSRLQACFLLGNSGISIVIVCALLTARGLGATLAPLLLGNAAVCATIGTAILLLMSSGRVADWIKQRLRRFETRKDPGTLRPSRARVAFGVAVCVLGRVFQSIEFGVALHAVGGRTTLVTAFATQGTSLVGAAVGDLVPGQVGVTEGAFRLFAETLGFGADPARALSIALVVRVAQLSLAVVALLTALFTPRTSLARDSPRAAG